MLKSYETIGLAYSEGEGKKDEKTVFFWDNVTHHTKIYKLKELAHMKKAC